MVGWFYLGIRFGGGGIIYREFGRGFGIFFFFFGVGISVF